MYLSGQAPWILSPVPKKEKATTWTNQIINKIYNNFKLPRVHDSSTTFLILGTKVSIMAIEDEG